MLRLREIREAKGMSQIEAAKQLNVSRQSYNFYENGKRDPDTQTLQRMAEFFNVSVDYLLGRDAKLFPKFNLQMFGEVPPENRKIPIIGSVRCGPNGLAFQYLEGYVLVGDEYRGDIVSFRCRGDSMKDLGITDGDIAIVRLQEEIETGELAVVVINGDEGTLKRVRKFEGGIILEAANQEYEPRVFTGDELSTVRIVGKVLEVRKKF